MEFRPCIDIHNGKVKQIVGGSLLDAGDFACENFVAEEDSTFFASLFKQDKLTGAHVIMLNSKDSEYFEATKKAALNALEAYPGGLQVGGGITADNAEEFIAAGASHVIVTSYVFSEGRINYDNLCKLKDAIGKERIVLDLSARKRAGKYYVVTDRWQTFTDEVVEPALFEKLISYCDEFLVHGVDVEGKRAGIDEELIEILSNVNATVTYAGGISSYGDIETIKRVSGGRLNYTVGSALDIYGGKLKYKDLI